MPDILKAMQSYNILLYGDSHFQYKKVYLFFKNFVLSQLFPKSNNLIALRKPTNSSTKPKKTQSFETEVKLYERSIFFQISFFLRDSFCLFFFV